MAALDEAAIVLGAGALSVAGVAFALLAATMAKRVTDIVGLAGGVVILITAITHLAPEALAAGDVERVLPDRGRCCRHRARSAVPHPLDAVAI